MLNLQEQEEYIKLHEEMEKREAIHSFSSFVKLAWPIIEPGVPYMHGIHIDAISEHLEACVKRQIRNLLINIPPRHSKSTLVSVLFPAWVWIRYPESKWIASSYAQTLSKRDSLKCRRILESNWYRNLFNIQWHLSEDQNEKSRFSNTEQGYRLATSVGGVGVGEGADFLLCDDPHKTGEVYSDVIRQGVLDWWDEVMSTRGNDPKTVCKIIIMQRLHENDLSGHVLEKGGYEHLLLPAEYEGVKKYTSINWCDPRKEIGELLWPERFGKTELEQLKKDLGSQASAGQLQQRPGAVEGNIVKRQWWKFYDDLPHEFDAVIQAWDLTFKGNEKTDFVVGQVWGKKDAFFYLIDQVRKRISFNDQIRAIQGLSREYPETSGIYIEAAANGEAAIDVLKEKIPGINPVKPKGSKIVRLQAVTPIIESGNVFIPNPNEKTWVHEFIEEFSNFPNAKHDDQIDAACYSLSILKNTFHSDWSPLSITGQSTWL